MCGENILQVSYTQDFSFSIAGSSAFLTVSLALIKEYELNKTDTDDKVAFSNHLKELRKDVLKKNKKESL